MINLSCWSLLTGLISQQEAEENQNNLISIAFKDYDDVILMNSGTKILLIIKQIVNMFRLSI
jgi:hypothetical protein